jgi:chromosome segregation ATPase
MDYKDLQDTERKCMDYTDKSHMSLSKTISNLGAEFKDAAKEISATLQSYAVLHAEISAKLDNILNHAKETNGRVHKLEVQVSLLEKETNDRDSNLEKLIATNEAKMKAWVWRSLLIVTLCGSFVWIKESRDLILSILKAIF